ncbi:MAG: InlB B-repeat-containing protein [Bacillota bacterium]|nr:InlB B-repeat-containing protein [Bacillota bacterium]
MKKILSLIVALIMVIGMGMDILASDGTTTITTDIPYSITLQIGEHGKVKIEDTDYRGNKSLLKEKGTVVTYTFIPDALYDLDKIIYNGEEIINLSSDNKFTAPALNNNSNLSVSFRFLGIGEDETYTISFDLNGHGTSIETQNVLEGKKAIKPVDPQESGWIFGGWFLEKGCINVFDFDAPIKQDMTLYAKWTKNTYDLTTKVNGGHGTISEGEKDIVEGQEKTISFTPDEGYKIQTVTVNGEEVSVTDNRLVVTMNESKIVIVTYEKDAPPHEHMFGDWKYDEKDHWKECTSNDGAIAEKGVHIFSGWKTIVNPTSTKEGNKERTCTICSYKEKAIIPVKGNSTNSLTHTGIKTNLLQWIVLMGISCGIGTIICHRKRKEK